MDKIYYEDYRLKIFEKENKRYDIYDSKYGGRKIFGNVTKEFADKRTQKILEIRKRREERRKKHGKINNHQ